MKRLAIFISLVFAVFFNVPASDNWVALFFRSEGLTRVKAVPLDSLDNIMYIEMAEIDSAFTGYPTHLSYKAKNCRADTISLDSVISLDIRPNIARVYIDTDSLVDEVPDKENYLRASLRYVPSDTLSEGLEAEVSIRGRGNTTWNMPKKPYRLKFDKKQELAGMAKAKNFVLIANYLDNSLMKNAVAFKVAELVGMSYYNSAVPVDLFFNGKPRGSYLLTQKIGINSGSADFDEYYGMLWEIDSYYDEEYRFRSSRFNLPCMAKDPDFLEIADDDPVTAGALWAYWKADLDLALAKVYDGKWQEVFDAPQLAKYVLVNHLCGNFEISQAKSIFLYKTSPGEKYCFGPVWDFDWALGFTEHSYPVGCQLAIPGTDAYDFWHKIFSDPEFQSVFREELQDFLDKGIEELMEYVDAYADTIRISAVADYDLWPEERFYGFENSEIHTGRYDRNVSLIKDYIRRRIEFIEASPRLLLY